MKNRQIEKALQNAVNGAPSIPFAEIAAMPFVRMPEHDAITEQRERKTKVQIKQFVLAAACCLLVLVSMSGWLLQNRMTDSVITLDVNPSIKISMNQRDKVIGLKSLNNDAKEIVRTIDFEGMSIQELVQTLVFAMVEHNYLAPDKNTILLTVSNRKTGKADRILADLDDIVRDSLRSKNIAPTILKQAISKEKKLSELADKYHISEGRMRLIQGIISSSGEFTMDQLVTMNLEQLYRIAKEYNIDLSRFITIDTEDEGKSEENTSVNENNNNLHNNRSKKWDDREKIEVPKEDTTEKDKYDSDKEKKEDSKINRYDGFENDKEHNFYRNKDDDQEDKDNSKENKQQNKNKKKKETNKNNHTNGKSEGDQGDAEEGDQDKDYDKGSYNNHDLEASKLNGNILTEDNEDGDKGEDTEDKDNKDDNWGDADSRINNKDRHRNVQDSDEDNDKPSSETYSSGENTDKESRDRENSED
jgi:hypothetical protein